MRPVPSPRLHRVGVLAIATAVASSTVIAAAPAQAHPAGDRAGSAGGAWLESQLTGGLVHNNEYDFATSAYSVGPGRSARIKLALTRPARAALGSERLRVVAVQIARGAESASTPFLLRRK